MTNDVFQGNEFGRDIFNHKYRHAGAETWPELAHTLVDEVGGDHMAPDDVSELTNKVATMRVIFGGRYNYYCGRTLKAYNNCYMLRAEADTREDWAELSWKSEMCLSTGGGIGVDYSVYRPAGSALKRTGGVASGPISKMRMINEIGREVMQGGSRRSAIYGSLNWKHADAAAFLVSKNWHDMPVAGTGKTIADLKNADFNYKAPLDMTNISLNYDDAWLVDRMHQTFLTNCEQACKTGEPGFSFNFGEKQNDTLRNACTELTSSDDSDVCNLGSLNMARIETLVEFRDCARLATQFLLCGTLYADLPYAKVADVRAKNRRLGLGLMGMHEWLLARGYKYGMNDELRSWLEVYRDVSTQTANELADRIGVSRPVATRAIAPTGTIGILAGTTTGIEPVFAVAYKRRYLLNGKDWHYQYVVDSCARRLIDKYGVNPETIESATDLAKEPRRRIEFQADVQDYVDHGISSTINLESWGSEHNNEDLVPAFAATLAEFAPRLRGFTAYPNGSRGGQPLEGVPYRQAASLEGQDFVESAHDICDISGKGGGCGT